MISFWCFFKHMFIYLLLTLLGGSLLLGVLSGGSELGLLPSCLLGLFTGVASLTAEHGLWGARASAFLARGLERRRSSSGGGAAPWPV